MPQSLLSRAQSVAEPKQKVKPDPRVAIAVLLEHIYAVYKDEALTSQAIASKLQRVLRALDNVPIPFDLRDHVLSLRTAIVTWNREDESFEDMVGLALDLLELAKKPPEIKQGKGKPDPTIVVMTEGDRITGIRITTFSYQGSFNRYSPANLPAYPCCRLVRTSASYLEHYAQGGRYLAKA